MRGVLRLPTFVQLAALPDPDNPHTHPETYPNSHPDTQPDSHAPARAGAAERVQLWAAGGSLSLSRWQVQVPDAKRPSPLVVSSPFVAVAPLAGTGVGEVGMGEVGMELGTGLGGGMGLGCGGGEGGERGEG